MRILVFGGSGTIGKAVSNELSKKGILATTVSNTSTSADIHTSNGFEPIKKLGFKFDGCIWAQGVNLNDTLIDAENFLNTLDANLIYIFESLRYLLTNNLLRIDPSLVIVSSVWQQITRRNKFSYTVSKAALEGLVNSVMADFSHTGLRINSVLPGVIDSKMTRENLSQDQLDRIESETPSARLVTAEELSRVIVWLLSEDSRGVNGQFLCVDNGWSRVRKI